MWAQIFEAHSHLQSQLKKIPFSFKICKNDEHNFDLRKLNTFETVNSSNFAKQIQIFRFDNLLQCEQLTHRIAPKIKNG